MTALLTLLPLVITLYVFYLIFYFLDNLIGDILYALFDFHIPGTGFAASILLIAAVDFIASNFIGKRLINYSSRIMHNDPLLPGMLILTPRNQVIGLDMTIEEGLKGIISGGLFIPHQDDSTSLQPGHQI